MTRILHVDHSAVLGGAERSVLELARAQGDRGDVPIVAVGRAGPFTAALESLQIPAIVLGWRRRYTDTPSRARLVSLGGGSVAALDAGLKLRKAMREIRPEIVQAHTRKAQLASPV